MKNLIQKLLKNDNDLAAPKDELIGNWTNWAADDNGLAAIWGYSCEFLADGTGIEHQWGTDIPKDEEKIPISMVPFN